LGSASGDALGGASAAIGIGGADAAAAAALLAAIRAKKLLPAPGVAFDPADATRGGSFGTPLGSSRAVSARSAAAFSELTASCRK